MDGRFNCVEVHEGVIAEAYFRKLQSLSHWARLGNEGLKVVLHRLFYNCKGVMWAINICLN